MSAGNLEIEKQVKYEKSQDPFKLYSRFYKSLYFPGYGHFRLGLKPKNVLYSGIAFFLLVLIFTLFFLSNTQEHLSSTLERLKTYEFSLDDQRRRNVLTQDDRVEGLLEIFAAEGIDGELISSLQSIK